MKIFLYADGNARSRLLFIKAERIHQADGSEEM
jgi:hypothetical protein